VVHSGKKVLESNSVNQSIIS